MVKRRHWSAKARVALLTKHRRVCHLCNGKIGRTEAWDVSHEIPLQLGGADDDLNVRPAHRKCHKVVTAKTDVPNIAKAKRREAAHLGARPAPQRPIQSRGFAQTEKAVERAEAPTGRLPVPRARTDIYGRKI